MSNIIARVSAPISRWAVGLTAAEAGPPTLGERGVALEAAFGPLIEDDNPLHVLAQLSIQEMEAEANLRRSLYAAVARGSSGSEREEEDGSGDDSAGSSEDGIDGGVLAMERAVRSGRNRIRAELHSYETLRRERDEVAASSDAILSALRTAVASLGQAANECGSMDAEQARLQACLAEVDDVLGVVERKTGKQRHDMEGALALASRTLRRLAGAYAVLRSTAGENACPVCLSRPVSKFAVPCGHTFCDDCVGRMSMHRCCMCRATVDRVRPLFYSS